MIRRIAHKTKPSCCRFIVYFMSRAQHPRSKHARRNAIARIIDNRGCSQTQGGAHKNPLVAPKSQETWLVGACRALAPCPKCCGSSSVSLMRRKKTPPYSRNTKRFSEKQLDRATRQETVIRNNGTYNFQTHFMLVSMSLPAPGTMSSPY